MLGEGGGGGKVFFLIATQIGIEKVTRFTPEPSATVPTILLHNVPMQSTIQRVKKRRNLGTVIVSRQKNVVLLMTFASPGSRNRNLEFA